MLQFVSSEWSEIFKRPTSWVVFMDIKCSFLAVVSQPLIEINLKGTVHPKVKNTLFLIPVVLFVHLKCFGVSCRFLEILVVAALEYNETRWHSVCVAQRAKKEIQQQCLFSEIMTQLLKIIHRPCCNQFLVGSTIFSIN